jgi:hypothetical protein
MLNLPIDGGAPPLIAADFGQQLAAITVSVGRLTVKT